MARFIAQWNDAMLAKRTRCSPILSVTYPTGFANEAQILEEALSAGRIAFHEERVDECLQEIAGLDCNSIPGPTACDEVVEPLVTPGGACFSIRECVDGWCDASESCPGTCRAYAQPGDSCPENRCGDGYCGVVDSICHASKALGADCGHYDECQRGLECAERKCAVPAAAPPAAGGERCGECLAGLYCNSLASGLVAGECRALPAPTVGDACDWENGCGPGMVCAGLGIAGATPSCAPWSDLGGPCVEKNGLSGVDACKIGLRCVEGRCEMPPSSGPCDENPFLACAARAYCSSEGQCVPKKSVGEVCSTSRECASDRCDGTCGAACLSFELTSR